MRPKHTRRLSSKLATETPFEPLSTQDDRFEHGRHHTSRIGWSLQILFRINYLFFSRRENNRQAEIKELTSKGIIPHEHEVENHPDQSIAGRSWIIGSVSALIHEILPAQKIVEDMVEEAANILQHGASLVKSSIGAKL